MREGCSHLHLQGGSEAWKKVGSPQMTTGKGSLDRGKPFAYSRKERFLSNSKSNLIKNKKYPLNRFLEQCLLEDSFSCVSLA